MKIIEINGKEGFQSRNNNQQVLRMVLSQMKYFRDLVVACCCCLKILTIPIVAKFKHILDS